MVRSLDPKQQAHFLEARAREIRTLRQHPIDKLIEEGEKLRDNLQKRRPRASSPILPLSLWAERMEGGWTGPVMSEPVQTTPRVLSYEDDF
ncbi:MAG: hypothetical protein U0W40_16900 [Acidimicrobiia bacterium]